MIVVVIVLENFLDFSLMKERFNEGNWEEAINYIENHENLNLVFEIVHD